MPNQVGQPCKLTPECQARFVEALNKGATYEIACNYAGVDYSTYRRWMIRAETETEGKYRELYDAIKKAEGEAALKWLAVIDKAMEKGEWQASAWKLERRYWKDYSKHVEVLGVNEMANELQNKIDKGAFKDGKTNKRQAKQDTK